MSDEQGFIDFIYMSLKKSTDPLATAKMLYVMQCDLKSQNFMHTASFALLTRELQNLCIKHGFNPSHYGASEGEPPSSSSSSEPRGGSSSSQPTAESSSSEPTGGSSSSDPTWYSSSTSSEESTARPRRNR